MPTMKPTIRSQQGFGLVEILVSILIIAVGLLGTIALQMRAMQAELESYQRIQAMILLDDMVDRLKANRNRHGCYELAFYGFIPEHAGTGSALQDNIGELTGCHNSSANDLLIWDALLQGAAIADVNDNNIGGIIGARGCIERITIDGNNDNYRVSVAWQGMHPTAAPPAALTCAAGLFGDETQRRVVSRMVRFATLQ